MSNSKGCGDCPRLKLLPQSDKPKALPEERNFYNSCPRQLANMPTTPCSMGKPQRNKKGRVIAEPACPWWVDSEEHNYCFWRYIHTNSLPDGKMDYLLQNEIAQLFGCSSTKVHFIVKEAIHKLKNSESLGVLADFSGGSDGGEDGTASIPDHFMPAESEGDSGES